MSLTLTEAILKQHLNPVFFETGTWYGGGVRLARQVGFDTIYTLDIEPSLIINISTEFPDIVAVAGDSRCVFSDMLSTIVDPTTFWLDSHALLDGQERITTVASELEALIAWWRQGSVVLVDDIRMFGIGGCWGESCSFDRLMGLAGQLAKKHGLSIHFETTAFGVGDIMVIK